MRTREGEESSVLMLLAGAIRSLDGLDLRTARRRDRDRDVVPIELLASRRREGEER